jgi:hypothetical protein
MTKPFWRFISFKTLARTSHPSLRTIEGSAESGLNSAAEVPEGSAFRRDDEKSMTH